MSTKSIVLSQSFTCQIYLSFYLLLILKLKSPTDNDNRVITIQTQQCIWHIGTQTTGQYHTPKNSRSTIDTYISGQKVWVYVISSCSEESYVLSTLKCSINFN